MDDTSQKNVPNVVIVGGGFGGLRAAKGLAKAPVRVTVIDRSNHHLFQPLLYQVATAGLSPADIATPIRSVLRKQKNTEVLWGEVQEVDTRTRKVVLPDREVPYDYLIIATGARYNYFGHDEWEEAAPGLKTIADATMLRAKILAAFEQAEICATQAERQALLTFVVVGAGPTGVEMAGSIADLAHKALARDFRHIDPASARVVLVEAGPRILAAFPEELSAKAQRKLEELGVEVRTGAAVQSVDTDGVVISDERLPSKTVMWAAGVVASPAGKWLGAEVDRAGRVVVSPDLTVPGLPEVYVIGDTASAKGDNGKPLPGVAPVAMQQGTYVADRIDRRVRGVQQARDERFEYTDKGNLATVGRSFAILDIKGFTMAGFFAWLTWIVVHIFYLIGFRNRFLVLTQWMWAYLTFQRGARLIVTAEGGPPGRLRRHDR
jgi:NADH dehydrogenase